MTAMRQRPIDPPICFTTALHIIREWMVARLPPAASKQLSTRGQVAVHGTINGHSFQTVVEPDGSRGHWIKIDHHLAETAGLQPGGTATIEIQPLADWPEPALPSDFEAALRAAPQDVQDLWSEITPMARWEWVRWVNATNNPATRGRRVEASISKMAAGKRRPCCFNLSACTDPALSRNGQLLDPV